MSKARKIREALLPPVLLDLDGVERALSGATTGWGVNRADIGCVRKALTYVRQVIEMSEWEIVDPAALARFQSELRFVDQAAIWRENRLGEAWQNFLYGDWRHPPPRRHHKKRALLQIEVDALYGTGSSNA